MKKEFASPLAPIDFLRASKLLRVVISSAIYPAQPCELRAHRECEICIVKKGQLVMNAAGTEIPMKENDFLFILPYVSHAFSTQDQDPCHVCSIHFNLDFLSNPLYQLPQILKIDLRQHFMLYTQKYLLGTADQQLKFCIQNIAVEYDAWKNNRLSMMNFYILELVLLLSRNIHSQYPADTDFHNPYVEQALAYIHEHYMERITVPDIAASLNISDRYLSRLFYQCTHTTVMEYIHSCRINQSIMLMTKGCSLTEIAVSVGYSSQPHYTKTFKKYMGQTPREYLNTLNKTI